MKKLFFLLSIIALPNISSALMPSDFNELLGYTVSAITSVDGDFEGCDYDKKIKLTNGWIVTCNEYNYHYAYSPDVVIFSYQVKHGFLVKALIDGDLYDMQSIVK